MGRPVGSRLGKLMVSKFKTGKFHPRIALTINLHLSAGFYGKTAARV